MVGHKLENFHQLDLLEVMLEQKNKGKKKTMGEFVKEKQQMREKRLISLWLS
jgi:hypothetical protein